MTRSNKEIKCLVDHTVDLWMAVAAEQRSKHPKAVYTRKERFRLRAVYLVHHCLDDPVVV